MQLTSSWRLQEFSSAFSDPFLIHNLLLILRFSGGSGGNKFKSLFCCVKDLIKVLRADNYEKCDQTWKLKTFSLSRFDFHCHKPISRQKFQFPFQRLFWSSFSENFRSICMLTTKAWMGMENYSFRRIYAASLSPLQLQIKNFFNFAISSQVFPAELSSSSTECEDFLTIFKLVVVRDSKGGSFSKRGSGNPTKPKTYSQYPSDSQQLEWRERSSGVKLISVKASLHESSLIRNRIKIKFPDMWNIFIAFLSRRGFFLIKPSIHNFWHVRLPNARGGCVKSDMNAHKFWYRRLMLNDDDRGGGGPKRTMQSQIPCTRKISMKSLSSQKFIYLHCASFRSLLAQAQKRVTNISQQFRMSFNGEFILHVWEMTTADKEKQQEESSLTVPSVYRQKLRREIFTMKSHKRYNGNICVGKYFTRRLFYHIK